MNQKKLRVQVKDLPQDLWVELDSEDVPKIIEQRTINLTLSVVEVTTYAGLRWEALDQAGHIRGGNNAAHALNA